MLWFQRGMSRTYPLKDSSPGNLTPGTLVLQPFLSSFPAASTCRDDLRDVRHNVITWQRAAIFSSCTTWTVCQSRCQPRQFPRIIGFIIAYSKCAGDTHTIASSYGACQSLSHAHNSLLTGSVPVTRTLSSSRTYEEEKLNSCSILVGIPLCAVTHTLL